MFKFGTTILSAVPVRKEPDDRTEMVTQLLFGELCRVIDGHKSWVLIKSDWDGYEGWADIKQLVSLNEKQYEQLNRARVFLTADLFSKAGIDKGKTWQLPLGSRIPDLSDGAFRIGTHEFSFHGKSIELIPELSRKKMVKFAEKYLNIPYLWGGRSSFGIDCSGLVQMAGKFAGLQLPRDASQQAKTGQTLSFITDALPGDLAFFDNDEGTIVHVGILAGKDRIIHASGKVRIDSIDHHGIYNQGLKKYTHKLRLIKSISDQE